MGRMLPADSHGRGPLGTCRDAIVLAGGRGTRMGALTERTPKPMLPLRGRPLIDYQLARLHRYGVERVVISTGYRGEQFAEMVGYRAGMRVDVAQEDEPLGTGGGCAYAATYLPLGDSGGVIVVNGDLLSTHDLSAHIAAHTHDRDHEPAATVHVRAVPDAREFGSVVVNDRNQAVEFVEKSPNPPSSLINAGTYILSRSLLASIPKGRPVSLERDIFPQLASAGAIRIYRQEAYFLDVGSPSALSQASDDVASPALADQFAW